PATMDLATGRCTLTVRMIALNMQSADGGVRLTLASEQDGSVTQVGAGTDFPADSVVPVNATLPIGWGSSPVHADMTARITSLPPGVGSTYEDFAHRFHKITTCPNITSCTAAPGPDGIIRERCIETICAVDPVTPK